MSKLSERGRKMVKAFASPKGTGDKKKRNMYPIPDIEHARNALARASQHGSPEERERVRKAVYKKFPNLKKS